MNSEEQRNKHASPVDNEFRQGAETAPSEAVDRGMVAVVGALRYLFVGLRVLIIILLFTFFFGAFLGIENFGGFFYVEEHEEAMLFRFGRLSPVMVDGESREVFGSGVLRWRWPYPVDEVRRISTQRPVVVQTQHFWPHADAQELDPMAQERVDIEQGLRPGEDGYLLTGDTNIMHMNWVITYQVVDPKNYYLQLNQKRIGDPAPEQLTDQRPRAPEVMVRNLLEQAVLREVATWTGEEVWLRRRQRAGDRTPAVNDDVENGLADTDILMDFEDPGTDDTMPADPQALLPETEEEREETLAVHQERLTAAVRERLVNLIAENDMGIRVREISLQEVQPPRPCRQAFLEVNQAAQQRSQMIDEARAYATRTLAESRSNAEAIKAEGEAYKSRIIARGEADSEVFQEIRSQYLLSPESVLVALYSDTLREVLPEVKEKYIMPAGRDVSREVRLLLGPEGERWTGDDQMAE